MNLNWPSLFGPDQPLLVALWLLAAVFASAFVRGYSGFGSSAILVSAGSLVLSPRIMVPLSLALEVIASLHMLPWVWRAAAWRMLGWLCLGMVLTVPLGIAALAWAPADLLRGAIAVVILAVSTALWGGNRAWSAAPGVTAIVGAGSGLANGFGALGGLPVVAYLLGAGVTGAVLRATLVVYLLVADIYAGALAGAAGIYSQSLLWLFLLSLPVLALGVWLGHRSFLGTAPERFRRLTLALLISLSLLTLLRALL